MYIFVRKIYLMTEKNKNLEQFSYALGVCIAGNLEQSGVNSLNFEHFLSGLTDAFGGQELRFSAEQINQIMQNFQTEQQSAAEDNLEAGFLFLEENRKDKDVVETDSGLQYKILTPGTGARPRLHNKVRCHYHGTLLDGTVFDSSVKRGVPAEFPVNGVIKGWVEALQLMNVGSKWRLFVPSGLAYGEQGAGKAIPPHSTLIFDVELLDIL